MEYILYYNKKPEGYNFYEGSSVLPDTFMQELRKICDSVPEPVGNGAALRYTPLQDYFLMSVIFRSANDEVHLRGVNGIVNFIMTGEEADFIFENISQQKLWDVIRKGASLLQEVGVRMPVPEEPDMTATHKIPEVQLLTAASYSHKDGALENQAFYGLETSPLPEVVAMLKMLPVKLRKGVSFHTDMQAARETIGIGVNFCNLNGLKRAHQNGLSGGMLSTYKYLYYLDAHGASTSDRSDKDGFNKNGALLKFLENLPCKELIRPMLVDRVSSWKELEGLQKADESKDLLSSLIRKIPVEELLVKVEQGELPESTLLELLKARDLPVELRDYILRSGCLSETGVLQLARADAISEDMVDVLIQRGMLSQSTIFTLIDSGAVSENTIITLVQSGFLQSQELTELVTILRSRRLRRAEQAVARYIKANQPKPEKKPRAQKQPKGQPKEDQPRPDEAEKTWLLKLLGKLAFLVLLILGFGALVKSLIDITTIPQEDTTLLVIEMNTVRMIWKLLGLTAVTAAISSFVTYHLSKWKKEKKKTL